MTNTYNSYNRDVKTKWVFFVVGLVFCLYYGFRHRGIRNLKGYNKNFAYGFILSFTTNYGMLLIYFIYSKEGQLLQSHMVKLLVTGTMLMAIFIAISLIIPFDKEQDSTIITIKNDNMDVCAAWPSVCDDLAKELSFNGKEFNNSKIEDAKQNYSQSKG